MSFRKLSGFTGPNRTACRRFQRDQGAAVQLLCVKNTKLNSQSLVPNMLGKTGSSYIQNEVLILK